MGWVRDVLTGEERVEFGRHTRDEFDWLCKRKYHGEEIVQRLNAEFAELISDENRRVRGAAVLWFSSNVVKGVGPMLVAAWQSHPELYVGVAQEWREHRETLDQIIVHAIARNALGVPGGLEIVRQEALRPGRGGWMVTTLVHADPLWLRANLPEIATNTPAAIDTLFFHLDLLGTNLESVTAQLATDAPEAGGALLESLHSRGLDLEQAVLRLYEQLGAERVAVWLKAVVKDKAERARYLELL